mgnify:CR=1 FL=1
MSLVASPQSGPTLLAIDTSSAWCSVALLHHGRTDLLCEEAGHGHSQRVLPMVEALLQRRGLQLRDCRAVAFGAGPGAFTGLRIACGVAQGLAFSAGLPVVPIDCVAATASCARTLAAVTDDVPVAVALDARMGEVYFGLIETPPPGIAVARLAAPHEAAAGLMAEVVDRGSPAGRVLAAGDGFARHPGPFGLLVERLGPPIVKAHARADAVAVLAARALACGHAVPAEEAVPLYVRDKVALDVDEQRALRAARDAAASAAARP